MKKEYTKPTLEYVSLTSEEEITVGYSESTGDLPEGWT